MKKGKTAICEAQLRNEGQRELRSEHQRDADS